MEAYTLLDTYGKHPAGRGIDVAGICPHCELQTRFEQVNTEDKTNHWKDDYGKPIGEYFYGIRRCPGCFGVVFVIGEIDYRDKSGGLLKAFPDARPRIDTEGYPELITNLLTEAIGCFHAGCYRASAIMVRRTLEEICEEFGAQGNNLHERLLDLPTKAVVPTELMTGLMDLKLLGNDAAHVKLKNFDKIEREEVDVALELVQEILRAWFRNKHLAAKLASLKKSKSALP
ncbi:MAG: DUF4145 domain-containing protein [Candidatus Sericytochromatia bacterium]